MTALALLQKAFPFHHRSLGLLLVVVIILVNSAATAFAQIDSEATNNTAAGADVLPLATGAAMTNVAQLAKPGNDVDFFSTSMDFGDVLMGMVTPLRDLPVSYMLPDTVVSVMQAGTQITFSDDDLDGQPGELPDFGANRGSLFRVQAGSAATYDIGVGGYLDSEFDGAATGSGHTQFGVYTMSVARINPANNGGGFTDTDPANNARAGADAITIGASGATVAVSNMLANDVDYYAVNLLRGQFLCAMIAPLGDLPFTFDAPDTLMGLFDSNGVKLVENDDAGDEGNGANPDLASDNPADPGIWGSAIRALIPADGVYYIGVTGYGDDDYTGDHVESGRYAMLAGVVTPPAGFPGDFNSDGRVDGADYVRWRKFLGSGYTQADYDVWRANFGNQQSGSGAQVGAVPEPAALVLFAAVGAIAFVSRQHRSSSGHR